MPSAATSLRRSDIRQQLDRPTGATLLLYVGRHLRFRDELYGYPEGAFFAAALDEVPVPPALAVEADKCGVDATSMPIVADVRQATLETLLAEAMVNAPALLGELTGARLGWPDWELRDLERKHAIAVSRLVRLTRLAEREMFIVSRAKTVRLDPGPLPYVVSLPPADWSPSLGSPGHDPPPPPPDPEPEPIVVPPLPPLPTTEPAPPDDDDDYDDGSESEPTEPGVPSAQVVERVAAAVRSAREAELHQRLPGGVRRRLKHFPRGAYVAQGDALDPRVDLAHAMADAQNMSKRRGEAAVIDWDGEWPVVARRYGSNGCTVYKVEDALRRAGVTANAA